MRVRDARAAWGIQESMAAKVSVRPSIKGPWQRSPAKAAYRRIWFNAWPSTGMSHAPSRSASCGRGRGPFLSQDVAGEEQGGFDGRAVESQPGAPSTTCRHGGRASQRDEPMVVLGGEDVKCAAHRPRPDNRPILVQRLANIHSGQPAAPRANLQHGGVRILRLNPTTLPHNVRDGGGVQRCASIHRPVQSLGENAKATRFGGREGGGHEKTVTPRLLGATNVSREAAKAITQRVIRDMHEAMQYTVRLVECVCYAIKILSESSMVTAVDSVGAEVSKLQ